MLRTAIVTTVLIAALAEPLAVRAGGSGAAAQAPAQVTSAEAAPFLGEWILALQGERGPGTFNLAVKVENDKVVADLVTEATPAQRITSISKTAKSLLLSYSFPYDNMTVDATITLTPGTDGKVAAQIDFAGGAYTMTGTASKKEKAK